MTGRRPLRFLLFVFEIPRLSLVLAAVAGSEGGAAASRAASFAAPHALFVLLAFFSWFDQDRYDSYRPLYVAGKLISAAALAVWVFMTVPAAFGTAGLNDLRDLLSTIAVAAVAAYDIITSVAVGFSVIGHRRKADAVQDLPELVVDELPDDVGGS
jgi:hypothetical protein